MGWENNHSYFVLTVLITFLRQNERFVDSLSTFLQVSDPLVQGCESRLHSPTLLGLIPEPGLPLLYAVHSGQHLLLQVVDFTLEQVFQAVCLH